MNEPTFVEGFHDKEAVQRMTYKPFGNTGIRVSKLSLGGSPFGGIYESMEEQEAVFIIHEAIRSGVNYIDTSPFYGEGRSEKLIGKALKDVPREAYYIATKIGRYTWNQFDFSAEKTKQSVNTSLKNLGLDYVDVIQVHDFEYAENLDQIINETLPTLQKIVEEGKARFIGITGYVLQLLKEVIQRSTVKIDCILTYARFTLIDDELNNYVPYFQEKQLGIINAAPLAMGLLTFQGPSEWHPTPPEIRESSKKATEYCKAKNIDIAKLAIQYSCTHEGIHTQLIGVGKLEYFWHNLKIMTEKASEKELQLAEEIRQKFFSNLEIKNWEYKDPVFEQLKEFRRKSK